MPLKTDIVRYMHKDLSYHYRQDIKDCVDIIVKSISDCLKGGGRVEIRGFGVFKTNRQRPRRFKNPKTNKLHYVPEKKRIIFKAGANFK